MQEEEESVIKHVTFRRNTLEPIQIEDKKGVKRRSGQPRIRWVETAMGNLWKIVQELWRPDWKFNSLNPDNEEHIEEFKKTADTGIFELTLSKVTKVKRTATTTTS